MRDEDDRSRAHRARLERHVQDGVEHAPAADRPRGLPQRDHLGVSGGVLAQFALVVGGRDQLAVAHHDRTDRDVIVFLCTFGFA